MKTRIIVFAGALAAAGSAFAQFEVAKQRSVLMRSLNQEAYSPLREIVRGQKQYDAAAVQTAYDVAEKGLKRASDLWPQNSPPDPKARFASSPKIWQSRAAFDQKLLEAQTTFANTRSQAGSGLEGLKAVWPQLEMACNSCHENYRVRQQ